MTESFTVLFAYRLSCGKEARIVYDQNTTEFIYQERPEENLPFGNDHTVDYVDIYDIRTGQHERKT